MIRFRFEAGLFGEDCVPRGGGMEGFFINRKPCQDSRLLLIGATLNLWFRPESASVWQTREMKMIEPVSELVGATILW